MELGSHDVNTRRILWLVKNVPVQKQIIRCDAEKIIYGYWGSAILLENESIRFKIVGKTVGAVCEI